MRYNLQVLYSDGTSLIIPDIDPGEVADFIEEYEDAEQFYVHALTEEAGDPDGGLPVLELLAA